MAQAQDRRGAPGLTARHVPADRPCNALSEGTCVLTLDGALPVEYLCPGDQVITRSRGTARLIAIHRFHDCQQAVAIAPGTLGHMRPDRPVVLPAAQEILLRDWRASALFGASRALVSLSRLVDGIHVRDLGPRELTQFSLRFDTPQILYADGLELASGAPAQLPA